MSDDQNEDAAKTIGSDEKLPPPAKTPTAQETIKVPRYATPAFPVFKMPGYLECDAKVKQKEAELKEASKNFQAAEAESVKATERRDTIIDFLNKQRAALENEGSTANKERKLQIEKDIQFLDTKLKPAAEKEWRVVEVKRRQAHIQGSTINANLRDCLRDRDLFMRRASERGDYTMELDLSKPAATSYIDDFDEDVDFEVKNKSANGRDDSTEQGKKNEGATEGDDGANVREPTASGGVAETLKRLRNEKAAEVEKDSTPSKRTKEKE